MIESKLKAKNCNRGQMFSLPDTAFLLDPTRSKQLSTVAILGFQFRLYRVVAPLSFLRSTISLASLFAILNCDYSPLFVTIGGSL